MQAHINDNSISSIVFFNHNCIVVKNFIYLQCTSPHTLFYTWLCLKIKTSIFSETDGMEERNINPRLTILCDAGSGGSNEYADISRLCGMRSAKKTATRAMYVWILSLNWLFLLSCVWSLFADFPLCTYNHPKRSCTISLKCCWFHSIPKYAKCQAIS